MLLIPAIDLKEGKCVRLRQGSMEDNTVFSDDPVAVAGKWVKAGAKRLHIVDLDGAFAGQPRNADIIKNMRKRMLSGHEIVIFPDRMKYNDLNDMVVKGKMSQEKILDVLENNLYNRSNGIMKLNEWSKL